MVAQEALWAWAAYRAAWTWGKELMRALTARHGESLPGGLLAQMDRRFVR